MNLPTTDQVNAASRNAASFAAGAIMMFGLSSKIDPETVKQIIAATGTLVNDGILLIGLVTPVFTMLKAAMSASQKQQLLNVKAMPGVENIDINAKASPTAATLAMDPTVDKIRPTLEAADAVKAIADKAA